LYQELRLPTFGKKNSRGVNKLALEEKSLQEFLDEHEEVNKPSFVVVDEESANWALRKIRATQEKRKSNIALAEAEIAKIDSWLEAVNEKADKDLEYFEGLLTTYAGNLRAADPEFKTLKLPYGKISFRKQQPKWEYDNVKLLESLKKVHADDLIRIKEEPDKVAIKKQFSAENGKVYCPLTGELIEGITVIEQPDSFKVEVK
jgi:phage host-nuclease inhibitor protein Gam